MEGRAISCGGAKGLHAMPPVLEALISSVKRPAKKRVEGVERMAVLAAKSI